MPMHQTMPDFVEKNHRKSTFVKEKNQTSSKGVRPEAYRFMAKADPKLIKAVPNAKRHINRTIELEKKAKALGQPVVNIFNLSPEE